MKGGPRGGWYSLGAGWQEINQAEIAFADGWAVFAANAFSDTGQYDPDQLLCRALTASTRVPGDLNGDGTVDSGDLDIVRTYWGVYTTPGQLPFDPNDDGRINSTDLDILRANWGWTGFAAVPEPSGVGLVMVVGIVVAVVRRRWRS